ncbi:sensor histidine kinase [Pseudoalteromonas aurantia]|uniref:histidine kinase n=1 Tax=Pseudoalteromonas aurantia TaxID=43654 RepID=A0A5S3VCK6_9GAMM|nr:HAMP domain-containing sensor histidine kinase [Pseudoalteromonas aurantia]TMO61035.1 sensor histidine kinase [Pseudoalteromonas aurantia]TMO69645.1 sensor histidine kinase [Pseudoalteromonas aurantia]TMO75766.1 sensor histidine kinase [Pseudoalteromonas aurantia]
MIVFSPTSSIGRLLLLRTIAIVLQLIMVCSAAYLFEENINLSPFFLVIGVESFFQLMSVYAYRHKSEAAPTGMLLQLLADLLFLTVLLSLSGGASNAFVSLLLLPIVIAAVTVPKNYVVIVALCALASYGYLFFTLPNHHVHHMDMHQHLTGMLVNFVFSVIVIVAVVMALVNQIQHKEHKLAQAREQQLKSEQIMALGSAAAQATHQLATPIANLNLLFEEIAEDCPKHPAIPDIVIALEQCKRQLAGFRTQTENLKLGHMEHRKAVSDVLQELASLMALQYPDQKVEITDESPNLQVSGDPMLLPALLNILNNAARANQQNHSNIIQLCSKAEQKSWSLTIIDHGKGIDPMQLSELGHEIVQSDNGMGIALLLSHATFERLNGSLTIENHPSLGAQTHLHLPTKI